MTYFGKFFSNFRDFYNEINASTLTGAIDVIVVEQPDGTFNCSPFHVRFGKLGVLRSREKVVDIEINGTPLDLHMKLGESGEAFFVERVNSDELGDDEVIPRHLICSPIVGDEDSYDSFEKSFITAKEQQKEAQVEEISKLEVKESPTSDTDYSIVDVPPETNLIDDTTSDLQSVILDNDNDSQIQPKTFRAETSEKKVSEIVRKVSCVTGEFRPIDMEPPLYEDGVFEQPEVSSSTTCEDSQFGGVRKPSVSNDSHNLQCTDNENSLETNEPTTESTKESVINDKRRRRKKSFLKKKSEMRTKKDETRPSRTCSCGQDNVPNGALKEAVTTKSNSKENLLKIQELGLVDGNIQPDLAEGAALIDSEQIVSSTSDIESPPESAGRKRSSIDPDFHFFSDTEATPGCSGGGGGRSTPVQSDSEVEKTSSHDVDEGRSWRWGELPTPPQHKVSVSDGDTADISRLSTGEEATSAGSDGATEAQRSMITSMFSFMRKKHLRQHPTDEGIYLSDINPEELDPEVAALYFPKSYHQGHADTGQSGEAEALTGFPPADNESGCGVSLPHSPTSDDGGGRSDGRPEVLKDIAMSLCGGLEEGGPKESVFLQKLVLYEDFVRNPKVINDPNLVVRFNGKYYNWRTACPLVMSVVSYRKTLPQDAVDTLSAEYMPPLKSKQEKPAEVETKQKEDASTSQEAAQPQGGEDEEGRETTEPDTDLSQLTSVSEDGNVSDAEGGPWRYRKTLRLSSEQIAGLDLRPGQNEVEFTVTSAYQGTSRCRCHVYRWRWDDKIVISDIDGTITKSDVLGHILPIVGQDWAQNGVAQLFTKIMNNGYKVLYLSARAIGQARSTRDYLRSIKQEDLCLPDGPLLLSPTGLLSALHREVIEKKPEEFKISCLRDIQALFPTGSRPFYAGYGNKVNDVWAYRAVGIPMFRIFTINHRGELRHEFSQTFQSSYSNMSYLVDQMFPPANTAAAASDDHFSNFVFWREPIPELALDETAPSAPN